MDTRKARKGEVVPRATDLPACPKAKVYSTKWNALLWPLRLLTAFLCAGLLPGATPALFAATLFVEMQNLNLTPVKCQVKLTPLGPSGVPDVDDDTIFSKTPIITNTTTSGTVYIPNLMAGNYSILFQISPQVGYNLGVPNTNGIVNARRLITNAVTLYPATPTIIYGNVNQTNLYITTITTNNFFSTITTNITYDVTTNNTFVTTNNTFTTTTNNTFVTTNNTFVTTNFNTTINTNVTINNYETNYYDMTGTNTGGGIIYEFDPNEFDVTAGTNVSLLYTYALLSTEITSSNKFSVDITTTSNALASANTTSSNALAATSATHATTNQLTTTSNTLQASITSLDTNVAAKASTNQLNTASNSLQVSITSLNTNVAAKASTNQLNTASNSLQASITSLNISVADKATTNQLNTASNTLQASITSLNTNVAAKASTNALNTTSNALQASIFANAGASTNYVLSTSNSLQQNIDTKIGTVEAFAISAASIDILKNSTNVWTNTQVFASGYQLLSGDAYIQTWFDTNGLPALTLGHDHILYGDGSGLTNLTGGGGGEVLPFQIEGGTNILVDSNYIDPTIYYTIHSTQPSWSIVDTNLGVTIYTNANNEMWFSATGGGAGGSATNVVWPVAGTNMTAQTNGLAVTLNSAVSSAALVSATNLIYQAGTNWAKASITNVAQATNSINSINSTNFFGQLSPTNFAVGVNASSTTFLRGDGIWQTPAGGSGGSATNVVWPMAGTNTTATTNGLAVAIHAPVGWSIIDTNLGVSIYTNANRELWFSASGGGGGSATNVVWPTAGTNIIAITNGLTVNLNAAVSNVAWADSSFASYIADVAGQADYAYEADWAATAENSTNFWGQLSATNINYGLNALDTTFLRGDWNWVELPPPGPEYATDLELLGATNLIYTASTNYARQAKQDATNGLWSATTAYVLASTNTTYQAATNTAGTYALLSAQNATNNIRWEAIKGDGIRATNPIPYWLQFYANVVVKSNLQVDPNAVLDVYGSNQFWDQSLVVTGSAYSAGAKLGLRAYGLGNTSRTNLASFAAFNSVYSTTIPFSSMNFQTDTNAEVGRIEFRTRGKDASGSYITNTISMDSVGQLTGPRLPAFATNGQVAGTITLGLVQRTNTTTAITITSLTGATGSNYLSGALMISNSAATPQLITWPAEWLNNLGYVSAYCTNAEAMVISVGCLPGVQTNAGIVRIRKGVAGVAP